MTDPVVPPKGNKYWDAVSANNAAAANTQAIGQQDAVVRAPGGAQRQPGSTGGTSTNNPSIGKTHSYTTVSAMRGDMGALYANDPREYKRIVKIMQKAGYNTDGSRSSVDWYWNLVLNDASSVADRMDPYEYLEWAAKNGLGKQKDDDGDGPGGNGPGGYSGPTYSIDLTTETDARAIVDNALNNFLGRDATAKERQKFWQQLNKAETANPSVATPQGQAGVVRSGGFSATSAAVAAEDFAKSRDDYAEIQASTTVLDWMTESIMKDQTEGLM
jgi:hypothetical protein